MAQCLRALAYDDLRSMFLDEMIDGEVLAECAGDDDLVELGISREDGGLLIELARAPSAEAGVVKCMRVLCR